jgi:hypothetical protein
MQSAPYEPQPATIQSLLDAIADAGHPIRISRSASGPTATASSRASRPENRAGGALAGRRS